MLQEPPGPLLCLVSFPQVDNEKLHLDVEDIDSIDSAKLKQFIHVHGLRWVTEYSPLVNTDFLRPVLSVPVSRRVLAPTGDVFSPLLVSVPEHLACCLC